MYNIDESVDRIQNTLMKEFGLDLRANSRQYIRSELLDAIRQTEDEARASAFDHANNIGASRRNQN